MSEISLRTVDLSKRYDIGVKTDRLTDLIVDAAKSLFKGPVPKKSLWALKNLSITVERGEVVGLVGHNGAGKSTLLKILSRITRPTEGTAFISGRVGSLIEVGTGFHAELTGRENVFLNGSILGMGRKEIDKRFDAIVSFAETGQFIDTPVKHYSSGMQVRLAFAVAAHLNPDVLLVDEVLAVGDLAFQEKCLRHFQTLKSEGMTILIVSHNVAAIQNTCDRVLLFEKGVMTFDGDPLIGLERYRDSMKITDSAVKHISREGVSIRNLGLSKEDGTPSRIFSFDEPIRARIEIEMSARIDRPLVNLGIVRSDGVSVCNFNNWYDGFDVGSAKGICVLEGWLPAMRVLPDQYEVHVLVWPWGGGHLAGDLTNTRPLAWTSFGTFSIHGPPLNAHHDGVFQIPAQRWQWLSEGELKNSGPIPNDAINSVFGK